MINNDMASSTPADAFAFAKVFKIEFIVEQRHQVAVLVSKRADVVRYSTIGDKKMNWRSAFH